MQARSRGRRGVLLRRCIQFARVPGPRLALPRGARHATHRLKHSNTEKAKDATTRLSPASCSSETKFLENEKQAPHSGARVIGEQLHMLACQHTSTTGCAKALWPSLCVDFHSPLVLSLTSWVPRARPTGLLRVSRGRRPSWANTNLCHNCQKGETSGAKHHVLLYSRVIYRPDTVSGASPPPIWASRLHTS